MIITLWILYTVFGILTFSLVFLWAVRARQFGDRDRARYLPLECGERITPVPPNEDSSPIGTVVGVLLAAGLIMLGMTLLFALVHR